MFRFIAIMAVVVVFLQETSTVVAQDESKGSTIAGSVTDQQAKKSDPWSELIGKWVCQTGWMSGKELPKETVSKMALDLSKGKFVAQTFAGEQKGVIELTNSGKQKRMLITQELQGQKMTIRAIYKIENGKMQLAYAFGGDYPTEFKSTAENQYLLVNYVRAQQNSGGKRQSKK